MSEAKHTLLLRLAGPMQSWGVQSDFTVRDTAVEPSKSGVIGLVCAALGRPRSAPIDDLALLRMGVRVDREGTKERDFHTAGQSGYLRAKGNIERKDVITSERYYLADARFLVGLEGDVSELPLLKRMHAALKAPKWTLSLGRKAFPPGLPVYLPDGLREGEALMEALKEYPWEQAYGQGHVDQLRYALEITSEDETSRDDFDVRRTQPDQPVSFQPREFAPREIGILHRPNRHSSMDS